MPETNFSLINLKGLSEPLGKLIDAIRSAVGIVYEPTHIRRKARADADAAVILARNQQDVQDIEIRASERLRLKEMRRQKNIEDVTRAAIAALPDAVSKETVNEDWIHEFYEHCQDIGNQQMQQLWGKILAGEVAKPGSFSLRCLRITKDIEQKDADLFTRFCSFIWVFPSLEGCEPIVPWRSHQVMKDIGVKFADLLHLEDIGLIQLNPTETFMTPDAKGKTLPLVYFEQKHLIRVPPDHEGFTFGHTRFTAVGGELAPISGAHPSEQYRREVVAFWRDAGYGVEEPS